MTTVEESCMPYSYKPYCFKNNKLNHKIKIYIYNKLNLVTRIKPQTGGFTKEGRTIEIQFATFKILMVSFVTFKCSLFYSFLLEKIKFFFNLK